MTIIRKKVFGSFPERENYYKLSQQWGSKYRIYHNLPFLMVFDINTDSTKFSAKEIDFLKKTSIDYTICDYSDQPLICFEFDGIQQGVSLGTKYYSTNSFNIDPMRKKKLELKLKIAEQSLFPFFIVSSKEFNNLSKHIKLSIVDVIIGQVLALYAIKKINNSSERSAELEKIFNKTVNSTGNPKVVIIDDRVSRQDRKRIALENSLLSKKIHELEESLKIYSSKIGRMGHSCRGVLCPADVDVNFATHIGIEYSLHSEGFGRVNTTAWLPNFNFRGYGYLGLELIKEIAHLLTLHKLIKMIKGECPPPKQKILGTIYFDEFTQ